MLYRDEHWQIAADLFARTWPPPPQPLQVTSLIAIQLHEQANIFKTDNHKFDPQAWFQLVITKRDEYWAATAATA